MLPMTPRGSSTISDAVDIELQILPTERDNITTLMCTKSRRTANVVRKGWHRDFFYDEDSLLITPLHEDDANKQDFVNRLRAVKEKLELSNYALAEKIGVHEKSIRRWLGSECLPGSVQLPKINKALQALEDASQNASMNASTDASQNASHTLKKETHLAETAEAPIYNKKEIKNKVSYNAIGTDVALAEARAPSGKRDSGKAKVAKPKSKKNTIDLNNPCASCPANSEKSSRFVDGEGDCSNGIMFIAQCPGEVEMTSDERRPLIGPASQIGDRISFLSTTGFIMVSKLIK